MTMYVIELPTVETCRVCGAGYQKVYRGTKVFGGSIQHDPRLCDLCNEANRRKIARTRGGITAPSAAEQLRRRKAEFGDE